MKNEYYQTIEEEDLTLICGGDLALFRDAGYFVGKALCKFFDHVAYCAMNYNLASAAK